MHQEYKDKSKAWFGTLLFHALLLFALFFLALKTPLPIPEEEGVEVDLGYSDFGQGDIQPEYNDNQSLNPENKKQLTEEQNSEASKNISENIVEEASDAPAIVSKPEQKKETEKKIEKPVKKEEKKPETEAKITLPKQEAKPEVKTEVKQEPVVDPRLLYTGKGSSKSEGNDQQAGDKGIPDGIPNAINYQGNIGAGNDGISYNLGNRKANSLPKPSYVSDDQGKVIVSIRVDKDGKVISAEIQQKGTTVSDVNLHNMARQAALKAIFAPDSNAPEIQFGTITYNFIKLN
ncbi:MAG: energy transducer TonB [Bacteroidota bacterium]|jgi:TonB family protein